MKASRSEHHGRVAADLALLTGFQGVPAEFRGHLAMVLLQRACTRLSAALGALERWGVVQAAPGQGWTGSRHPGCPGEHGAGNRASVGASGIQADAVQASGGGQR